jgi:hypothetical protein
MRFLEEVHVDCAVDHGYSTAVVDHFKCPAELVPLETSGDLSRDEGYFRCGEAVGYGRLADASPSRFVDQAPRVEGVSAHGIATLPFDLSAVVDNLRKERYCQRAPQGLQSFSASRASRRTYYFLRPLLGVSVRKHLQKLRLAGWERILFPRWPVEFSVEDLMHVALAAALRATGERAIPFIWFWPDAAPASVMMTHDVEGASGCDFCGHLMDLDESYGIRSSFQFIPESASRVPASLWDLVRRRGFEANLHDLNHDGALFQSRRLFAERVARINQYARDLNCRGFRSGAMYREQAWFDAFEFSYDMSVPNVAHLEPQRGGCCTVMPYFVGDILELPLTATQDYSLFHIIGDYSTKLWRHQIELIRRRHGLISFITHPDYLRNSRARSVYRELLAHLVGIQREHQVWMALPGEIDLWWRSRHAMQLVRQGGSWRIVGPGSERARLAWARLDDRSQVAYSIDERASA